MVSPKSKGNARENQIANFFKEQGFMVMVSPRTMRRVGNKWISSSNDYFGLFDLCVKDEFCTRWIQVKSHMSDYYKARKKILEKLTFFNRDEILEIWVRTKKNNKIVWRVFNCNTEFENSFSELARLDNKFRYINK